jgi:hypothetical protein
MSPRYLLPRVVPTILILFGISGIWDDNGGVLGVISGIGYFGSVALALATVVALAVAGVRHVRRPAEG